MALDPRNRVTQDNLDAVWNGGTCWLLQASLVMDDLRTRYPAFKNRNIQGIIYRGRVIALGSDRSDAYLYNAGTPEEIRAQQKDYRTRRAAEIRQQIQRLEQELEGL